MSGDAARTGDLKKKDIINVLKNGEKNRGFNNSN